jgi:hypothetical protein
VFGGAAPDIADLVGKVEVLGINVPFARPAPDGFPAHPFFSIRYSKFRWNYSLGFSAICSFLYTTASTASSSTDI